MNRLLGSACVAVAVMLPSPVMATPEQVRQLTTSDSQAASALGETLWSQPDGRTPELGLALVDALIAAKRTDDADRTAHELHLLDLAPAQQARLLAAQMIIAQKLNLPERDAQLTAAATALMPQLPPLEQSDLHNAMGTLLYLRGRFDDAARQMTTALGLRVEVVDEVKINIHRRLGAAFSQLGRFPEAIESYQAGLQLSDNLPDHKPIKLLRNLAGTLSYLGQFEESIRYAMQALELAEPVSDDARAIESNMGVAYQQMGDLDQAEAHYARSLAIADKLGQQQPALMNNMAYLQFELGNHKASLALLDRAVAIYEKNGQVELAMARKNQGENWMALGNHVRAAEFFEQSYQLYLSNDLKPKRLELYPLMIENLEILGQVPRALALHKEFKLLSEELVTIESTREVAELRSAIEVERSERAMLTAQRDSAASRARVALLESQRDIDQRTRWVLIASLLLASILVIYLFQNARFRARANKVLGERNGEIEHQHTRLKQLSDRLRKQSREDELTGLFNRRYLNEFLDKELPRLARVADDTAAPSQLIILADLDHFKQVNDKHGHAAGDELLKAFAATLTGCARADDICVRWGGEEFLWLCRNATLADAKRLADRLLQAAADTHIEFGGARLTPHCSIGVAPFPMNDGQPPNWDLCIKAADAALYQAKHRGRNQWVLADLTRTDSTDTLESRTDN